MKLPNNQNALVGKKKLRSYLLSLTHPKEKSKAKFFRYIGFNESNITSFEKLLLKIGRSNEIILPITKERKTDKDTLESILVTKYVVQGTIDAPNGKTYKIRTVWIIDDQDGIPHLATAYPNV